MTQYPVDPVLNFFSGRPISAIFCEPSNSSIRGITGGNGQCIVKDVQGEDVAMCRLSDAHLAWRDGHCTGYEGTLNQYHHASSVDIHDSCGVAKVPSHGYAVVVPAVWH